MNNELRREMIKLLETHGERSDMLWGRREREKATENHAGLALSAAGHIAPMNDISGHGFQVTLSGLAYLEELKHPIRTWLFRNWFALAVAASTIGLAALSSIAQLVVAFRT